MPFDPSQPYQVLNAPSGFDPSQPFQIIPQAPASQPSAPPVDPNAWGTTAEVVNSLTGGFGDELAAGVDTGLDWLAAQVSGREAKPYDKRLDEVRAARDAYRQESPVSATASQIGGGLGAAVATPIVRAGGPILSGALTGSLYGGLYGFGEGEGGLQNRAENAVEGAKFGAVTGAAIPAALKGIGKIVEGPANAIRGTVSPENYATSRLLKKMEQDNVTVDDLIQRLDAARAAGATEVAIPDVAGENTRRLLRTATNISGPGREKALTAIEERAASRPDRVQGAIKANMADPEALYPAIDDIIDRSRVANSAAYEAAYAQPIDYSRFPIDQLRKRIPPQAVTEANRLMQVEGAQSPQILAKLDERGNVAFERLPDVRQWDYIQRALGEIIRKEDGAGALGTTSAYGRAIGNLQKELLGKLDKAVPEFGKARSGAAEFIQMKQAADAGREFLIQDIEQVRKQFAKMSPDAKAMARIGFARTLKDKLYRSDTANPTANVWNRRTREIMDVLFPSASAKRQFETFINAERGGLKTSNAVRGNSTTAAQLADLAEEQGGAGAVRYLLRNFQSGLVPGLTRMADDALGRMSGLNERSGEAVVNTMFGPSSGFQKAITDALLATEQANMRNAAQRDAFGRLATFGAVSAAE